jgi:hypothetical protein
MYIKKRRNASGSTSIQIIEKDQGKTRLIKTIGSSDNEERIVELERAAQDFITGSKRQLDLELLSSRYQTIKNTLLSSSGPIVKAAGPALVLGTIFDAIGFNQIAEPLFRHLV